MMTWQENFNAVFDYVTAAPPQPFKPGDVCLCGHGFVGMITAETPDKDGVWKGVHLHPDKAGDPWESKKPKRVLNTEPFVRFVKLLETAGV